MQPDRFSGGLRLNVQQVWDLAAARCRFGKYLRVEVNGSVPPVAEVLRDFPSRRVATEHGELPQGLARAAAAAARARRAPSSTSATRRASIRPTRALERWQTRRRARPDRDRLRVTMPARARACDRSRLVSPSPTGGRPPNSPIPLVLRPRPSVGTPSGAGDGAPRTSRATSKTASTAALPALPRLPRHGTTGGRLQPDRDAHDDEHPGDPARDRFARPGVAHLGQLAERGAGRAGLGADARAQRGAQARHAGRRGRDQRRRAAPSSAAAGRSSSTANGNGAFDAGETIVRQEPRVARRHAGLDAPAARPRSCSTAAAS